MAVNEDRQTPQLNGDAWQSQRLHPPQSNTAIDGRTQKTPGSAQLVQDSYNADSTRYQNARQPINDAVASAFNSSEATSAASFSPEILQQITSQITANVLQQLKASSISMPPPPPPVPASSQMDGASSSAGSPPLDRATVYTPPSPHRTSEEIGISQSSPQFPPQYSNQSSFRANSPVNERRVSSPVNHENSVSEGEAGHDRNARPKGPKRISTGGDLTTLERVWGTLFDEHGQGTARLGQFLRGIATHLIEKYEPEDSLVITPAKLQRYYEETRLPNEVYPWNIVFDDRTSSISRMFREIEVQHHLVQEKLNERPDLPGLTPKGFETWATLLLKAHPDHEFERLAKTALNMPISNPDEKKERFPKELSRRLLPTRADTEIAYKLQKTMSTHCNLTFDAKQGGTSEINPRASQSSRPFEEASQKTNPRPPPEKQEPVHNTPQPSPALSQGGPERQRQPYTGKPAEVKDATIEEEADENTLAPQPIERERKPYVAAPGAGKNYDNIDKPTLASESKAPLPPPPPPQEIKLGRSNSVHASNKPGDNARPNPISLHQRPPPPPMDVPESRRHRSNSAYHRDQPRVGRNRSPSMTKENGAASFVRRADTDGPHATSSYYASAGNDPYEDARRYREYEAQRERLVNDRYDAARMSAYDPRERERERERDNRPRMQSVAGFDGPSGTRGPPPFTASVPHVEEDYYRDRSHTSSTGPYATPTAISTGFQPPPPPSLSSSVGREAGYGSYPPNSYREMR